MFGIDRKIVPAAPHQIQIEITTRCNYACVMCPHASPIGMPGPSDIAPDMVDRVIGMLDKVAAVHPTGTGEPLMAEGFWRLVDALKGRTSPTLNFHTNGSLLTKANVARLMEAPLGFIVLSMDAATTQTYSRIRGGNFDRIVRNARDLIETSNELSRPFNPMSGMVLMVENYRESSAFVRLCHDIGFKAAYLDHMTDSGFPAGEWVVEKPGFRFVYDEQRIVPGHPHATACDKAVADAIDVADELGIQIGGLNLFVERDSREFNTRPCRSWSAQFYSHDM